MVDQTKTTAPFPQRCELPPEGRAVFRREDRASKISCPMEAAEVAPA